MNTASSTTSTPRRWRRILFLQAVFVLVGLGALELGARAWSWIQGEPYRAAQTRRDMLQLLDLNRTFVPRSKDDGEAAATLQDNPDQDLVLHPYLGWEMVYGNEQLDGECKWLHSNPNTDDIQIMIVGGSVAANFCVDSLGWDRMCENVRADPKLAGRTLHLTCLARGGYKEPQQINFVNYLLGLGFKPAAVINIDGFNEVALGNNNRAEGSHPSYPSAAHWGHLAAWNTSDRNAIDKVSEIRSSQQASEAWGSFVLAWQLEESCILGKLAVFRMNKLRRITVDQFEAYGKFLAERRSSSATRGPMPDLDEPEAVKASVQCWKESSRSLADLCRARGIIYIHVLQPTLHDTGSKPLTAKEIETGEVNLNWIQGVKLGYPLLRKEGEELRRLGVDFIDASQIFADRKDDLYFDCCHFVNAGHGILSDKIGPELLRRLKEKQ